jgi:hypothetical protein
MAGRWTLLELGTAKVDITPRTPVPLAGFNFRTGVFDRVEIPLFARVFCFKFEPEPPVILVSADLIWWGSDRIDIMRRGIRAQSGLERAAIVLHATHTHSGPQTSERMSPLIGAASTSYIATMEEAVIGSVRDACAALEPVRVERASAACPIGIHRRRLMNGEIRMAPNHEGPNDRECTVVRFRTVCGGTKAVLVHFTCHPTTTAGNFVSAEFCGVAMTAIERGLGNDVTAAYLQGCCGDVRPALIRDGEFYRGDANDVLRLGEELAGVVSGVLSGPMEPCEPGGCASKHATLALFFENIDAESAKMEMTCVRLTRDLGFLTFNAETVVAYGLFVKRYSNGSLLPLGYTNGMIGYVTTEQQLIEGGYEPREAFQYFGMPGPFASSTERRVCEAITAILR